MKATFEYLELILMVLDVVRMLLEICLSIL